MRSLNEATPPPPPPAGMPPGGGAPPPPPMGGGGMPPMPPMGGGGGLGGIGGGLGGPPMGGGGGSPQDQSIPVKTIEVSDVWKLLRKTIKSISEEEITIHKRHHKTKKKPTKENEPLLQ